MPIPCVSQLYRPFLMKGGANTRVILPVGGWSMMKTPCGSIERHPERWGGVVSQEPVQPEGPIRAAYSAYDRKSHITLAKTKPTGYIKFGETLPLL